MYALKEAIQQNNGMITYRELERQNLSYSELNQLVKLGQVEVDDRGIYRLPEAYIDEYFSLQYRFSKGIYSLETALWLHGLSLTVPFEPVMTFPYGTNTVSIRQAGIKPVIVRSFHDVGIVELERQEGQMVLVYDMERTLVECLRGINRVDVQVIGPAFKMYFQQKQVNLPKLFEYAKLFKVEKKLQSYVEVLS